MNTPRIIIASVATLSVTGLALWLTVLQPSPPKIDPAADAREAAARALAKVPAALKSHPDLVTANVRLAAQELPSAPEALVKALVAATHEGPLALRDPLEDAPEAPRSADRLAQAFIGQAHDLAACPFELATFAAALLNTRADTEIGYGWIPGGHHGATQLIARRYALRVGGGPWLALDDQPLDQGAVRPLDEVGFTAQLLGLRALGAMKAGDADTASSAANHARRLAPDDAAITFTVGLTQLNRGLLDMGVATMERASKQAADGLTWYTLGRLSQTQERPFRADRYFRQAVEADPRFVNPRVALAELAIDRLAVTPEADHAEIIAAAKAQLDSARVIDDGAAGIRIIQANLAAITEDLPAAERYLREEIKLHPSHEDGWLYLTQLLALQERDAEALKTIRAAAAAGVDTPDVLKTHAVLASSVGSWDEAREALEQALERSPDDPEVRPQLAQLYRAKGRVADARRLLADQVRLYPEDLTALLLSAQLEMDAERWDTAFALLDKALAKAPENKEAVMLDYVGRLVSGRPAKDAEARAVKVLGSHREIAQYLLEQDLDKEAEAQLLASVESEPEDAVAPVLLVGLYHRDGRLDEAKALRAKTLERFDERDHDELNDLFDEAIRRATAPAPRPTSSPQPGAPQKNVAPKTPTEPGAVEAP